MNEHFLGSAAEWTTAAITLVSAFFIVLQLQLDHERSRRENSVNLVREWTDRQKIETAMVVRLVKNLNEIQCRALYAGVPFDIEDNIENKEKTQAALQCPNIEQRIRVGKITLSAADVAHIRFFAFSYLNHLESILAGWNSGIAAGSILQEQFQFLRKSNHSLPICRSAVQAVIGEDPFPSITNFLSAVTPRPGKPLGLLAVFKKN